MKYHNLYKNVLYGHTKHKRIVEEPKPEPVKKIVPESTGSAVPVAKKPKKWKYISFKV
jgi:hypothetical protein